MRVIAVQLQDPPAQGSQRRLPGRRQRPRGQSRIINEAKPTATSSSPGARPRRRWENQAQAYKETRILQRRGRSRPLPRAQGSTSRPRTSRSGMYLGYGRNSQPSRHGKLVLPKDAADRVLPLLPLMQSVPRPPEDCAQEQPSGPSFRKPEQTEGNN